MSTVVSEKDMPVKTAEAMAPSLGEDKQWINILMHMV